MFILEGKKCLCIIYTVYDILSIVKWIANINAESNEKKKKLKTVEIRNHQYIGYYLVFTMYIIFIIHMHIIMCIFLLRPNN